MSRAKQAAAIDITSSAREQFASFILPLSHLCSRRVEHVCESPHYCLIVHFILLHHLQLVIGFFQQLHPPVSLRLLTLMLSSCRRSIERIVVLECNTFLAPHDFDNPVYPRIHLLVATFWYNGRSRRSIVVSHSAETDVCGRTRDYLQK
eukprot:GHVT01091146.1.p1 GENE.GHVT01091146.1~~GHVT01091146.1.p1  ORF type:complete len:149 (-),score=1.58 GHVT01091146.1:97-543(-)